MKKVPEDWAGTVAEFEAETLREIRQRLARGGTVTLTEAERAVLLAKLEGRLTKRLGRPPKDEFEDVYVAMWCDKQEASGKPTKAVVADAMEKFGMKRSKVYAARTLLQSK